jgi:hypothetical protein
MLTVGSITNVFPIFAEIKPEKMAVYLWEEKAEG